MKEIPKGRRNGAGAHFEAAGTSIADLEEHQVALQNVDFLVLL